jgi:hypothetical protein
MPTIAWPPSVTDGSGDPSLTDGDVAERRQGLQHQNARHIGLAAGEQVLRLPRLFARSCGTGIDQDVGIEAGNYLSRNSSRRYRRKASPHGKPFAITSLACRITLRPSGVISAGR